MYRNYYMPYYQDSRGYRHSRRPGPWGFGFGGAPFIGGLLLGGLATAALAPGLFGGGYPYYGGGYPYYGGGYYGYPGFF
ncbi:hypothetical protein IEO70_16560 [Bacillus sp. AGMB 02131]|uniref:Uncharacterized protein n=1 Tax=Peribacillus faecalis TaxID=2772559 RepID=A0A927CYA4_9BACI|nr:hypothetical protein [Peribacillus faecalis]MBD3109953.1 hypothetical protein [Peribacillus faecalis]